MCKAERKTMAMNPRRTTCLLNMTTPTVAATFETSAIMDLVSMGAPGWPDMLRAAEFASLEAPGSPIGQSEPLGLEEVHGSGELRTVNDALQAIVEDAMLELSTGPHWARLSCCRQGLMIMQYRVLTL